VAAAYLELYAALARFFRSCQRADHTGLPVASVPRERLETVGAVEEDVGREGLAKGESVEGKLQTIKQRRRRWFGRRKAATTNKDSDAE
jgi:hypothetical protein